jgi:hypothetical protein
LPFNNFYGLQCPLEGGCISYPSTTRMKAFFAPFDRTYDVNPFDAACGAVHFPPNARGDYDYGNTQQVLSSCTGFGRHQGTGGADRTELVDQSHWFPRFAAWDDCGGEFMIWWYQNMPAFGSGQTFSDGRPMKSMWPFMVY